MKEEVVEKTQKRKLNESIINIRVKLQNAKLKKTGKNKFAGFDYFELADFLPKLNELMLEENINDRFVIGKDEAKLTLIKGNESQEYVIPFVLFDTPLNKDGKPSMQDIQYLGALNTYYKRYLLIQAFCLCEDDEIEHIDPNKKHIQKRKPQTENLSNEQLDHIFNNICQQCVYSDGGYECLVNKIYACHDMKAINNHDLDILLERAKKYAHEMGVLDV